MSERCAKYCGSEKCTCGAVVCEWCHADWEEYESIPSLIGTEMVRECGDGCCWNRAPCIACNGSGLA